MTERPPDRSPKRPLFRPEAVEHHARGRTERRVLDLAERRTAWVFRLVMLVVAAALVAAFTIRADESATGDARVEPGEYTAVVTLPVGALGRVQPGQPVHLGIAGEDLDGYVANVGRPVARRGTAVVPVTVALDTTSVSGRAGVAVVHLGRRTLAALLLGRRG